MVIFNSYVSHYQRVIQRYQSVAVSNCWKLDTSGDLPPGPACWWQSGRLSDWGTEAAPEPVTTGHGQAIYLHFVVWWFSASYTYLAVGLIVRLINREDPEFAKATNECLHLSLQTHQRLEKNATNRQPHVNKVTYSMRVLNKVTHSYLDHKFRREWPVYSSPYMHSMYKGFVWK